ncbi:hypothetical protein LP415_12555 [Polaromonas sp. P1(28)-8]|nr:hypothetical protein LP415_12555 [Polaromonas sp. P1(28)-8]
MQELAALDEKRSTLAQRHGRELLDGVVRCAKDAGLTAVECRQRHGNLVEALLDMEPEGRLFVLGQHHHAEQGGKRHLDHTVERAIRSVQRPVLVAAADYREPKRFVIAFDGSPTGRKMIETVARSQLLKGLRCDVVMQAKQTQTCKSSSTGHERAWLRPDSRSRPRFKPGSRRPPCLITSSPFG